MKVVASLVSIGMAAAVFAQTPAEQTTSSSPQDQATVTTTQTAASATECELHVWPAERFQAMTTGWLSGFGMVGALADSSGHAQGDKARRSHLASALDSEGQLHALQELDLVNLLSLKQANIIVHNQPLDRKTVNTITTRRAESVSPCYSEIIVADVFYQKAAIYGRSLKTLFIIRDFGKAVDKPTVYKTWGGNGLKLFLPKEGEDVTAADAELVQTFKQNFEEAAQNYKTHRGVKS